MSNQKSTLYVEHPVPVPPTRASMDSDEPLKFYQTKKELKRIRRQTRAVQNKEKQDKIAVGLLPPPPPKVKISNLLRVLSEEQAADPSLIEAKVKAEMEQRQREHLARNLSRKLTPEERLEKQRRRVEKDAKSPIVNLAVFRLTNMTTMQEFLAKKRMASMSRTAKSLMVNGRVIIVAAPSSVPTMVLVEGGPKSIRKFTRLMLKRINWGARSVFEAAVSQVKASGEESDTSSSSDSESSDENGMEEVEQRSAAASSTKEKKGTAASCVLVWEGTSSRRDFDGFRREQVDSALDAKQMLAAKNLGHLWDALVGDVATEPR